MIFDDFNKFDFTFTFFSFFSPSPPFSYYTERKLFLKTIDTVFYCKMNLSFSVLGKDHRDHLLPHIKVCSDHVPTLELGSVLKELLVTRLFTFSTGVAPGLVIYNCINESNCI